VAGVGSHALPRPITLQEKFADEDSMGLDEASLGNTYNAAVSRFGASSWQAQAVAHLLKSAQNKTGSYAAPAANAADAMAMSLTARRRASTTSFTACLRRSLGCPFAFRSWVRDYCLSAWRRFDLSLPALAHPGATLQGMVDSVHKIGPSHSVDENLAV